MNRERWATALLEHLDAPVARRNLVAVVCWIAGEGGFAAWNPLNTTKRMPGSVTYNSVGVQEYTGYEQGMAAVIATLHERDKGYEAIIRHLQDKAWPARTMQTVYDSQWGTQPIPYLLRSVKRAYDFYANQPIAS
jgi:hypothetical protein